jgi:hypothetical protein
MSIAFEFEGMVLQRLREILGKMPDEELVRFSKAARNSVQQPRLRGHIQTAVGGKAEWRCKQLDECCGV